MPIPLPPDSERRRILEDLSGQNESIRRAANAVQLGRRKSQILRAALLAEAFAGRLVPQDPNDEPAAELLARIRAERAAAVPVKRQRAARAPRTRKELAAPPTRVTSDNYEQGALPL